MGRVIWIVWFIGCAQAYWNGPTLVPHYELVHGMILAGMGNGGCQGYDVYESTLGYSIEGYR
jgi:hypothetical protein